MANDSSLPSTWNEGDTDLGLESSNTACTSVTPIDENDKSDFDENDARKVSVHYKTLLWLTSVMLNDASYQPPKNSGFKTKETEILKLNNDVTEKDQFQLVTSRIIKMGNFKNRCRRSSLCETEMKAYTQNKLFLQSYEFESISIKKISNSRKKVVQYPKNLMLSDIYYFMVAPTLCYELNFPRSGRIRSSFLLRRAVEVVVGINLLMALAQQWIIPSVVNSLIPFSEMNLGLAAERILKLAIPNHMIWLTTFYLLFHSYLNTLAEILQFADRLFYKDWWNSVNVGVFWRTWNIPVHQWFVRHVYKPILGIKGCSKAIASTLVFFVSAILHEYAVSVPLQMFKAYAFLGMFLQLPLMGISKAAQRYMGNRGGNVIVWMSLIIGQPLALLMYYHDFVVQHYGASDIQNFADLDTIESM